MKITPAPMPKPFYDSHIQAMHPMPDRQQTMYLSSVNEVPSRVLSLSTQPGGRPPCSLRTDDINAQKPPKVTSNNFILRTDDLNQKNQKKSRISSQICPNSLNTENELALKPRNHKFVGRHIPTNPLNPEYPGIKEAEVLIDEGRFIKNPLEVADIDGAQTHWRAKVKKQRLADLMDKPKVDSAIVTCQVQEVVFRSEPHNGQTSQELELRKHSKRNVPLNCEGRFDNLDVKDIAHAKSVRLSKRCVDPMNPQYFYYDINKNPAYLDPIKKCRSILRRVENRKVDLSLYSGDIEGTQPNTNQHLLVKGHPRKNFVKTNDLSNIENIHPGSAKKCIKTKRCINPLERDYSLTIAEQNGFLIGSELKDSKLQDKLRQKGKKIIDAEERLKAKKNWDIINHKVKDPSIVENLRSEGKMINLNWIRPPNDLFLLDQNYCNQIKPTKNLLQSKATLRNPISGVDVEQKILSPLIITDEERLNYLERVKQKSQNIRTSFAKENQCEGIRQQRHVSGYVKRYSARKDSHLNDAEFAVCFRPIYTHHEKFNAFINQ